MRTFLLDLSYEVVLSRSDAKLTANFQRSIALDLLRSILVQVFVFFFVVASCVKSSLASKTSDRLHGYELCRLPDNVMTNVDGVSTRYNTVQRSPCIIPQQHNSIFERSISAPLPVY